MKAGRVAVGSHEGAQQKVTICREAAEALRKLVRRQGATLYMGLLGTFEVLLARYTGQEEMCVGTPIAGRTGAKRRG